MNLHAAVLFTLILTVAVPTAAVPIDAQEADIDSSSLQELDPSEAWRHNFTIFENNFNDFRNADDLDKRDIASDGYHEPDLGPSDATLYDPSLERRNPVRRLWRWYATHPYKDVIGVALGTVLGIAEDFVEEYIDTGTVEKNVEKWEGRKDRVEGIFKSICQSVEPGDEEQACLASSKPLPAATMERYATSINTAFAQYRKQMCKAGQCQEAVTQLNPAVKLCFGLGMDPAKCKATVEHIEAYGSEANP